MAKVKSNLAKRTTVKLARRPPYGPHIRQPGVVGARIARGNKA